MASVSTLIVGTGCPGSGGFAPELRLDGCPQVGQQVTLLVENALGATRMFLFLGLQQASMPLGGCSFLLSPVPQPIMLPIGGDGPGSGSLSLSGIIPAGSGGASFTAQGWIQDPTGALGVVATNGIDASIGN